MLPITIYTKKRIFKYYTGLSFFIFIWISRLEKNEERLRRHEVIHFRQQIELLFVFHWLLYVFFYMLSRAKGHPHYVAYRYNPFELEAYTHDANSTYLEKRRIFAWVPFVRQYKVTWKQNMTGEVPAKKEITWNN